MTLPESLELAADSLALVELYQTTDGANWDNQTGWLQDNRFDWFGVDFNGRRVTAIALPENGLLGDASQVSMGSLSALTSLDLSNNDLTGLGDLGSSSSLVSADLSGNQLDFGDFQNQSKAGVFKLC